MTSPGGEAPGGDPVLALASALEAPLAELRTALERAGLAGVLPPRPARFLNGWSRALARALSVARVPALAATAFTLADAVPALDELAFAVRRSRRRGDLLGPVEEARAALAPALEGTDVRLLPRLDSEARDLAALEREARELGLEGARRIEVERVPSRAPAGMLVALERRGVVEGESLLAPARVHVSAGEAVTPRVEVLEAALVALEAARPSREDLARLASEVDRSARDDPRANGEAAVRFAVSALERAGAVREARAAALAFLARSGISPLWIAAGERFDPERHPAACFERRWTRARAGVTRGLVVATELTGFRDERGLVLERAVVVVAE